MIRRPPGEGAAANKLILALVILLASTWLVDAQQPQASAARRRVESPLDIEDVGDVLHTATRLAQKVEAPLISERRKRTISEQLDKQDENDASAIATLAPAERAVRAPTPRRSTGKESAIVPQHVARDLGDWEVEEIVLLATVDGNLHGRDRKTGKEKWILEVVTPMVEATYHKRNRSSLEGDYLEMDGYLWVVEPSRDGSIFIYIPGGGSGPQGLVKTPLTMKNLVEEKSPYADSETSLLYTGEKKTTMVTVDIANGRVVKWFGAGGAVINDESSCSVPNSPLDIGGVECTTKGTFTLGRTEYRVDIHAMHDGHPIATLKYSEWQPNNYDNDLYDQYRSSKDGKYIYARHDGGVFAADLSNDDQKPLFTQKLSSPVARVYDVVRPWGSEDQSPELVVLPQPIPPAGDESLSMRQNSIFLNHTEDGSWYAMSGTTYPSVVTGSQQAKCDARDWWLHGPMWENLDQAQLSKAMVGLHTINTKRGDFLTISGPSAVANDDSEAENGSKIVDVIPVEPQPSSLVQTIKDLPATAGTTITDFISNPMFIIMSIVILVLYFKDIKRWTKSFGVRRDQKAKSIEEPVVAELPSKPVVIAPVKSESEIPALEEQNKSVPAPASADEEKPSSPVENGIFQKSQSQSGSDEAGPNEKNETRVPGEKKKAHRGKRGGVKHKKGIKKDSSNLTSEDHGSKKPPATVEEAVKDAQELGPQTQPIEPDVRTVSNGVQEVSGPVLVLGSLEVDTDKLIGTGSNGTMVFEGKFDGRSVAVKRMLIQFYDIASQETKLLRESDEHENVIRYYAQQQAGGFLYIALQLCPASLADVIDKPKAQLHRDLAIAGKKDLPDVLKQITNGLKHLHDLRIVHRDLKPQNILVTSSKEGRPRLLVSDFGLCKKLEGEQSSFRATTAHAAGTSGWRAPELLLDDDIRDGSATAIEASTHTEGSGPLLSGDMVNNRRATRAIDIFSLGLVFFYVLTEGRHPYDCGDRYMREINIRQDKKNLSALSVLGDYHFEAEDLISSMLKKDPKMRPTARDVLAHPFFWSPKKRLAFLCEVSDHFEKEIRDPPSEALQQLEYYAAEITRGDFLKPLGKAFVDSLGKQRKYTGNRMLDLLRALRNKKNHYQDMSQSLREHVGDLPAGYLSFWTRKFPNLLITCWNVVYDCQWDSHDVFLEYYKPEGTST